MKQAVLVVSFGTTCHEALEKDIKAVEGAFAEKFPGWQIHRAFTSGMVIRRLKERDGLVIENVEEALARLVMEGYRRVAVQPTHILNGEEYEKLLRLAYPWKEKFEHFAIGTPLLTTVDDHRAVVSALLSVLPEKKEGRGIVLFGHGTEHYANSAYAQLEYMFHDRGREDIFVGTVEGYPSFEEVLAGLKRHAIHSVQIHPIMVVAGDHVKNDMSGSDEASWKNRLEAAGIQVECIMQALGEMPLIQRIFIAHAEQAVASFADVVSEIISD